MEKTSARRRSVAAQAGELAAVAGGTGLAILYRAFASVRVQVLGSVTRGLEARPLVVTLHA
jgi:hypothetical protein